MKVLRNKRNILHLGTHLYSCQNIISKEKKFQEDIKPNNANLFDIC